MKKTQFLELLNNIKETIVSFISITLFVALSIAVFVGISWTSKAIPTSIDNILNNNNARDIELIFPYGVDKDDIEKVKHIEGVDEVEGCYTGYAFLNLNNVKYQARLLQVRENYELPILNEGRIPEKQNEIGISDLFAEENDIKIGDKIVFVSDNDGSSRALVKILDLDLEKEDLNTLSFEDENLMAYLTTDTFIVTGTMKSTEFMTINPNTFGVALTNKLNIDCFAYLPECAFDAKSFAGYPDLIIRSNELRDYATDSKEYTERVNELSQTIKDTVGQSIASGKSSRIKTKINDIITTSQSKLDDAYKQIEDGEKQIESGKVTLAQAKKKIDESLPQLESAEEEYKNAEGQLNYYKDLLNKAIGIYNGVAKQITTDETYVEKYANRIIELCNYILNLSNKYDYSGIRNIAQNINDYINDKNFTGARDYIIKNLNTIYNYIEYCKGMLDDYFKELDSKRVELDNAWAQYNSGLYQYNQKKKELVNAENQLPEAKAQYQSGLEKLNEFKTATSDIVEYGCTTITRCVNASMVTAATLNEMLGKLRFSMAALFVVVGLLVCYSAISRIVNDQIIGIGTKKALGITQKEVTSYYLSYTGLAILIGCILGNAVGYCIIQPVLVKSISDTFTIELQPYFSIKDAVLISLFEIILLIGITYFACRKILNRSAFKLLQGQEMVQGKRRFYESYSIWNRLSLFTKTIINNCFNEKRRVFGTIIGILGSASLIVTALTLNDNILNSFDKQYQDITHFEAIVSYDETNPNCKNQIKEILDKNGIENSNVLYSRMYLTDTKGENIVAFAFVPDDIEEFKNSFTLIPTKKNNDNNLYEGFWMSTSYYSSNKIKKDEPIRITNITGEASDIILSGYFEYYLTNCLIIVDKDTYKREFNQTPSSNSFLINTKDISLEDLDTQLKKVDGYVSMLNHKVASKGAFAVFETLSKALVAIYMVLSILMSLLVLLNLLTMFIDEKKRELIVLMINGYTQKQAKRYIYTDTIFLSVISIFLGCIVGSIMGNVSVTSFESTQTHFLHQVDLKACLISIIATAFLTFVVTLIALRKISKFKITDINKQ